MSLTILLDMDGVVTNFIPALIEQYNFLTNEGVKEENINGFGLNDFFQDSFTAKKIKDGVGFLRNLQPTENSIEAITLLKTQGHDIVFVSSPTNCPTAAHEKREWLNYYFSKVWRRAPLITTPPEYKKYVRGDLLLDDDPKNLKDLHATTKPLLWHTKQNASAVGLERIYSWDHFIEWVKEYENESIQI